MSGSLSERENDLRQQMCRLQKLLEETESTVRTLNRDHRLNSATELQTTRNRIVEELNELRVTTRGVSASTNQSLEGLLQTVVGSRQRFDCATTDMESAVATAVAAATALIQTLEDYRSGLGALLDARIAPILKRLGALDDKMNEEILRRFRSRCDQPSNQQSVSWQDGDMGS